MAERRTLAQISLAYLKGELSLDEYRALEKSMMPRPVYDVQAERIARLEQENARLRELVTKLVRPRRR